MALKPYRPTSTTPWNLRRVWMLHRRAGFGATWEELQRDLSDGPKRAVERFLTGEVRSSGVPDNYAEMQGILGQSAVASDRPERLIAWWIYQMYFSPDPLRERVALMWHNHFATSNAKVRNLNLMFQQNEAFRKFGLGRFAILLSRTLKHACMLKWLDGNENRAGKPNENLGRETLELFTLGVGNFDESDVRAAARALTGWSVKEDEFCERIQWHDVAPKTMLGKTGPFDGDDLLKIAIEHPATPQRLAWRLCHEFLSPGVVGDDLMGQLAEHLRRHDLDMAVALETILRSERFFSAENLKGRIVEPESFVVGHVRALEMFDPPASTIVLGDWIEQLGRKLFFPSNVGGWPGGKAWINSRTSIARANFGVALGNGSLRRSGEPPDLVGIAKRHLDNPDPERIIGFYSELLTGESSKQQTAEVLQKASTNQTRLNDIVRQSVALIVASPNAQLS